ncbi:MAG TPA: D-2-hydroxyacid dehydrogenase, partial [Limosilactobacillus ingluviei]|nr:D-2-hydroxyacid dehydrogenase [Limosilactobacillus ingluviei]
MTKILMTSVRPDEQAAIQAYAAAHQIKISTTPKELAEALNLLTDV